MNEYERDRIEREAAVREAMERDRDFLRGDGRDLSLADARAYGEMLAEANLPTTAEMEAMYAEWASEEQEFYAQVEAEEARIDARFFGLYGVYRRVRWEIRVRLYCWRIIDRL